MHYMVKQKQFPVGQGGLHLTQLFQHDGQNRPFSFVYDCGGIGSPAELKRQMSVLRNSLRFVGDARHIDLMTISHLHMDHISGFEQLIGATTLKIGTLLLPHYDKADIALLLASAANDGATIEGITTLNNALQNPEGWFGDRGVQQVRQVTPSEGEGAGGIVLDPPDDLGGDDVRISETDWLLKVIPQDKTSVVARVTLSSSTRGSSNVVWQFLPYARRQSPSTKSGHGDTEKLKIEVDKALKGNGGLKQLDITPANAKKIISDLTKAYKNYGAPSGWNAISLTLASGTSAKTYFYHECCCDAHFHHHWRDCREGSFWMHTGDAQLCNKDGVAWSKYFENIRPLATVFQAPHHGSHLNLDQTTIKTFPATGVMSYATCMENDRKHPHNTVKEKLNAHGMELLEITQNLHSGFSTYTEFCC